MEESEKSKAKQIRRAQRDMKAKIKEIHVEKKAALQKNAEILAQLQFAVGRVEEVEGQNLE